MKKLVMDIECCEQCPFYRNDEEHDYYDGPVCDHRDAKTWRLWKAIVDGRWAKRPEWRTHPDCPIPNA